MSRLKARAALLASTCALCLVHCGSDDGSQGTPASKDAGTQTDAGGPQPDGGQAGQSASDAQAESGSNLDGAADGAAGGPGSGELDQSFGNQGLAQIQFTDRSFDVRAMTFQSDGKIVLTGGSKSSTSAFYDAALARLNNDGSPDTSFGSGGLVTMDFGSTADAEGYAIHIDSSGNFAIAGQTAASTTAGTLVSYFIAHFDANGKIVDSFGSGGRVYIDPNGSKKNTLNNAGFDSAGNAYFLGVSTGSSLYRTQSVTRVLPTGQIDQSFGLKGKQELPITTSYAMTELAFQTDGKLLLCGGEQNWSGPNLHLRRLNGDGSLDAETSLPIAMTSDMSSSSCGGLQLQDDGSILAGAAINCPDSNAACTTTLATTRFTPAVQLDSTFGNAGLAVLPSQQRSLVRICVGPQQLPWAQYGTAEGLRTHKLKTSGAVDDTFAGGTGYHDLKLNPDDAFGSNFGVQADGRVVTWVNIRSASERYLLLERFWP